MDRKGVHFRPPLRGLSCACFQASTDKSRPVHLVKQLATARSKFFKASTADMEGVPLARCIILQRRHNDGGD